MKGPDPDRERSEKKLSMKEFGVFYNQGLPTGYPPVTNSLLKTFSTTNPQFFKHDTDEWSLDQHRKKVMDWLPSYLRNNAASQ
jgi:hypothetical protein